MICFHFSIFEPLETTPTVCLPQEHQLWFAFILVSLNHWKQPSPSLPEPFPVVICFHFSIFEPLETTGLERCSGEVKLWFAFILVSLNHWKQHEKEPLGNYSVVICFHFSIFEPLETTLGASLQFICGLWFAFILVSLNHWKQPNLGNQTRENVVICFHFSIFEPLETTNYKELGKYLTLWFAFILVSLNHWKQLVDCFILFISRL